MTVNILYNTVSFEAKINCNDATIQRSLVKEIKGAQKGRITDWFEIFIDRLLDATNNEPVSIELEGCDVFEQRFLKELVSAEENIALTFSRVISEDGLKEEYDKIDSFLNLALHSSEEIIQEAIEGQRKNIEIHRNIKIEVPVIATMSSGKSTFLNAMIGQDFLHEDHGATTATTCMIDVDNSRETFHAEVSGRTTGDPESEGDFNKIKDFLETWNKKANSDANIKLKVVGPVPDLNTEHFQLSFIDTPGPNSNNNSSHREQTYTYIKDQQNLPIILYLLDPENIDSTDHANTFNEVSGMFRENKQNLDRILFIYNKVDDLYIKGRSLRCNIQKLEEHLLKEYKIEKPVIFPVSSLYAKYAQSKNIDDIEQLQLQLFSKSFSKHIENGSEEWQIMENAPLSENQKEKLRVKIEKGAADKNMVYSGFAAVKLYIEDYITNHHQKNQYKELLAIAKAVKNDISASIALQKEEMEVLSAAEKAELGNKYQNEIEELNKKKTAALEKIKSVKVGETDIKAKIKKIDKAFNQLQNEAYIHKSVSKDDAIRFAAKAKEQVENLKVSFKTTFLADSKNVLENFLQDLKSASSDQFSNNVANVRISAFNAKMVNNLSSVNLNGLKDYEIHVRRTKIKEVESKWWIKRALGIKVEEQQLVTETYTNIYEFYTKAIDPISKQLIDLISAFNEEISSKSEQIREFFESSLNDYFHSNEVKIFEKRATDISDKQKNYQHNLTTLTQLEDSFFK